MLKQENFCCFIDSSRTNMNNLASNFLALRQNMIN